MAAVAAPSAVARASFAAAARSLASADASANVWSATALTPEISNFALVSASALALFTFRMEEVECGRAGGLMISHDLYYFQYR